MDLVLHINGNGGPTKVGQSFDTTENRGSLFAQKHTKSLNAHGFEEGEEKSFVTKSMVLPNMNCRKNKSGKF
jgi:hypothetical protein